MESRRSQCWDKLPFDLWLKISEFIISSYTLRSYINIKRFHPFQLSKHPKAIDTLICNPDMFSVDGVCSNSNPRAASLLKFRLDIDWQYLSENPASWAGELILNCYECMLHENSDKKSLSGLSSSHNPKLLELLSRYPQYIKKYRLSGNTSPYAIALLRRLPDYIDWHFLSGNTCPQAIKLLSENINNINWDTFSGNDCPQAIEIMALYPTKINWRLFSSNKSIQAFELMKRHIDRIHKSTISTNKSPYAIELMKLHPELIDWNHLSHNDCPQAMELLAANLDKICWDYLVLCRCPEATTLLMDNIEGKIASGEFGDFRSLCTIQHPKAIEIVSHYLDSGCRPLSKNPHPDAINLLKANPQYISCEHLCYNMNPKSMELLLLIKNITEKDLRSLSITANPYMVNFICKHNLFPDLKFGNIDDAYFVSDPTIISYDRKVKFLSTFNIRRYGAQMIA